VSWFPPKPSYEFVIKDVPDNELQRNAIEALAKHADNFVLLLDTPNGIVAYAMSHDAEGLFEERCVEFIEEGMT
jgi:hypothetical protein